MDKIPVQSMEGKVSRKSCGCMLERHMYTGGTVLFIENDGEGELPLNLCSLGHDNTQYHGLLWPP